MLQFKNIAVRKYELYQNDTKIRDFELTYEPGSKKYPLILKFIEDMAAHSQEFENWYVTTIQNYCDNNFDFKIIKEQLPSLKSYCDEYLEFLNINFDRYINKSKASKSSIFFDADEIKKIIKCAMYLKIYYTIEREVSMKLSKKFHKEAFQFLVKELNDSVIIIKLHKIVSSKTFEYNHTDKYMWNYIRNLQCETPDMHISHIFNFIINNILATCEVNSNPIPYIISVIDESIKWILKDRYNDSIVYSDSIATQDVNSVSGKDNLETYAHNNTIGAIAILATQSLDDLFEDSPEKEKKIEEFKAVIESIKETSIFAEYFTYPILSKVLEIPYRHFLTLSCSTSYLLNIILHQLLDGTKISEEYPTLRRVLLYYNIQKGILKTTYKMKNINEFTKTFDNFIGFKNLIVPSKIYSSMIGKLIKNQYCDFVTTNDIPNFPRAKLEKELIAFYNSYFSGDMEDQFDIIREKIDERI